MYSLPFTSFVLILYYTLGVTAAAPACSSAPYKNLLVLSSYTPALSYCTSKYPIPVPTCTAIVTKINTITASAIATSTSSTTTITVTTGTPGTTTITSTITPMAVTITTTVTQTTTSTILNNQKRAVINTALLSSALNLLTKTSINIIQTACSCIETTPVCTTRTSTQTSLTTSTSTSIIYTLASTTTTVPNTLIVTEYLSVTLPPTTATTTTTTIVPATVSAINAPRCDPSEAFRGAFNRGGCQRDCYCNADSNPAMAYCVDDQGSLNSCSSDADCPAGEFCDASIDFLCDSGVSCTSTYQPPGSAKRDVFALTQRSRFGAVNKRVVNKDGPNYKAWELILNGTTS